MSFSIFFLGGEQGGWRSLLAAQGVQHLGVSYWGLRRRMPKRRPLEPETWGFKHMLLDSGGYTANRAPDSATVGEWEAYAREYRSFVEAHIDAFEIISEFDCRVLGPAWIEAQRKEFWNHIDPDVFLPIWHPEDGLERLDKLGERYKRVGVAEKAFEGAQSLAPRLNGLVRRDGTMLHGVAVTKPDVLRDVEFATAASTSWLSPMQYGDTIVFDGGRLHRYPKRMKDQARLRHRGLFEREGFDVEAIERDDANEVARLSVWSWLQEQAAINALRTNYAELSDEDDSSGTDDDGVGTRHLPARNAPQLVERATVTLPVLSFVDEETTVAGTGEVVRQSLPIIASRSARRCDNCPVARECPAFEPSASCKFEIPIEVRTKEQRRALMNGLIEMQAQRVAFASYVEQSRGGYPDPNLSQEYDRLLAAFKTMADLEDDRDFLKISVEARGRAGVLSRLFGAAPEQPAPDGQRLGRSETDVILGQVLEGGRVTR